MSPDTALEAQIDRLRAQVSTLTAERDRLLRNIDWAKARSQTDGFLTLTDLERILTDGAPVGFRDALATEKAARKAAESMRDAALEMHDEELTAERTAHEATRARVALQQTRITELENECARRCMAGTEEAALRAKLERVRPLLERASQAVDLCEPEGVRDVWMAEYDEWMADTPTHEPPAREEFVCVACRERNVTSCDIDRCCNTCGADLCERAELQAWLAAHPAPETGGVDGAPFGKEPAL